MSWSHHDKNGQKCFKVIKLLMLGESSVGKTSLVTRYADNKFDTRNNMLTVGIDTRRITRTINGKPVRIQFWDTAGQQKYKTLPSQYFRGIQGVILVYDITQGETFMQVESWLQKLQQHHNLSKLIVMLVGNKVDLQDQRQVRSQEANQLAISKKMKFKETSAKTKANVEEMVQEIANSILEKGFFDSQDGLQRSIKNSEPAQNQEIRLGETAQKDNKKKGDCCS